MTAPSNDIATQMRQQAQEAQETYGGTDTEKGFIFIPFSEYMAGDILPPQWLIKNYLEKETLSVLFGPPESFKSFVVLDWGLSIAAQIPWNGNFVKSGTVFSIIGEGRNGYKRRIAAWQKANMIYRDIPFFVSKVPAQILDINSAKEVGKSINALRDECGTPALVIIDTLARNFGPGHENDTQDMTAFVYNLDEYVGRDFSKLIVHHSGLSDQGRVRGNSSLKGAVDAEYKMADKGGVITLSCTKMKDAPKFKPICFKPEIVDLGGTISDPITSIYLTPVEGQDQAVKLSTNMEEAIRLLKELLQGKVSFLVSEWRNACTDENIYARQSFYSACDTLSDKGIITIQDGYVSLS